MSRELELLQSYLNEGLLPDTVNAREAYGLLREIGRNGHLFEQEHLEFLFHALDRALLSQFLLSIARMYDPPSRRNEIRSLGTVLDFLEQQAPRLKVVQRPAMLHRLSLAGMDVEQLGTASDEALTRAVVAYFRRTMPDVSERAGDALSEALRAVKTRRDKALAHSEHVPDQVFPSVTWKEAENLIAFAEALLAAVAMGYLSLALSGDDGEAFLARDAERAPHQLHVLLARAGIVKDERVERVMAYRRAHGSGNGGPSSA